MNKWLANTRRLAAIMLAAGAVLALTATAAAQSQRFPDVPPDHYAYEAVEWAAEAGVTLGYGDGTFRPDEALPRWAAVVFMERYYDNILQAAESEDFTRGDMMVLLKAINDGTIGAAGSDTSDTEEAPGDEPTGASVVVDPAVVPSAGSYDFTISGAGFDPSLAMLVLICTIPGDLVTHETPAEDLAAAMAQVVRSDCDLSTAQPVSVDSDGSFSVQRSADVGENFLWVAADAAETQTAGAPVFIVVTRTVTVGDRHGCILEADGTVNCGGYDAFGVSDPPEGTFSDISAGTDMTCGVRTDGTIACWGDDSLGMADAPSGAFTDVAVGGFNSCAVRTDETVTCWGRGSLVDDTPERSRFSTVAVGGFHACGLLTSGTVTCWGPDEATVAATPAGSFAAVDSGGWHSCGLRPDGTVTCWGGNRWGQIDAPGGTFKAVYAGWAHSCGLRVDGTIECWGDDRYGQPPEGTFVSIDGGGYYFFQDVRSAYACGIRTTGRLTCWGGRSS